MDTAALEQNLTGVVLEMALKMGLTQSPVALNYPLASLNALLHTQLSAPDMLSALEGFFAARSERFGQVSVQPHADGFCLTIPPKGVAHIRQHAPGAAFLTELIETARAPGCTPDALLSVFHRHGKNVHVTPVQNEEFDYLVYFEDGVPDSFRYCLDVHDGFVSYHRFSKEDYEAFGF